MYKNTKEKGITLVALVITIIVLLILAGLTISYISNGGIIDKTKIAMNNYEDADKKEQEMIDDINKKNKDEIELEPVYSEKGAEDNIAPAELFEYEIINDGSMASSYMQNLPTKTARITGIKLEYCNVGGYDPIKKEINPKLKNTNYEIIYNGERIEDVLVIPYQIELDENGNITESGEMYKITEVNLHVTSYYSLMNREYGSVFPNVKKIVYPNTVEKIDIKDDDPLSMDPKFPTAPQEIILSKSLKYIPRAAFFRCSDLVSIEIPDSVESIGDNAFYGCSKLSNIEIPESVTSIGDSAFDGCYKLNNIVIPDSVKSIENNTFLGCEALNNIVIPKSVQSIGDEVFYGCNSLEKIVIPDSVQYIGNGAFDEWNENQTIYFECSEEDSKNWDPYWKKFCYAKIVWDYQGE